MPDSASRGLSKQGLKTVAPALTRQAPLHCIPNPTLPSFCPGPPYPPPPPGHQDITTGHHSTGANAPQVVCALHSKKHTNTSMHTQHT